ncbi:unnamed protein product [Symbiodinium necroappetens]|uniref:Uncharacterized protein n=1 Tax=Symbiodinium necroappetens TaxID=1628268 RepID=A0A812IYP4_9DINO|nr:unnamed protein product [Symbiodinium necroappetens]
MTSDTMQLCDDMNVADRVDQIMSLEPVIDKTAQTVSLQDSFTDLCSVAHGTNLAAACSALRNTNGQLVPVSVLGQLRASGATPEQYLGHAFWLIVGGQPWAAGSVAVCVGALAMHLCGDLAACFCGLAACACLGLVRNPLRDVVFAADVLHFGVKALETAERYSHSEAGMIFKLDSSRSVRRSEASLIPAILIGELVDPRGKGAALNKQFQNPTDETVKSIPVGNPLYGKTVEEIKEEFADQVIGERLKIRGIFVAHPTNAEQDPSLLELVKELVRRIALEQRCDYSDIHVGLLRKEVATFKEALSGHRAVTRSDIQLYLFGG